MKKWHMIFLFFYKFYDKVLEFLTRGDNKENVLVKICKSIVS